MAYMSYRQIVVSIADDVEGVNAYLICASFKDHVI